MVKAKNDPQQAKVDAAEAVGLPGVSSSDIQTAQKEGIKEAEKESAKASYRYATDGNLASDTGARQFTGSDAHTNMIDGMLALAPDDLIAAIDEKADQPLTEEQVANLLRLERAGPNRTPHVQALCKRLKVKSPYEVTNAGPGHTNDVSNVTPVPPVE